MSLHQSFEAIRQEFENNRLSLDPPPYESAEPIIQLGQGKDDVMDVRLLSQVFKSLDLEL